jgi:hypothetical protein
MIDFLFLIVFVFSSSAPLDGGCEDPRQRICLPSPRPRPQPRRDDPDKLPRGGVRVPRCGVQRNC